MPRGRPERKVRLKVAMAGLAVVPAFASCAVRDATPDGITIVYNTLHPQFADYEARQHCGRYGNSSGDSRSPQRIDRLIGPMPLDRRYAEAGKPEPTLASCANRR